jgi:hypothetical protein
LTMPTTSTRESMALVAASSVPGSIEARLVHGCTCAAGRRRERVWTPADVEYWQGVISLGCPAHGRLLERYVMSRVDARFEELGRDVTEEITRRREKVLRRPLWVRIGWAIRGWLAEW